MAIAGSAGALTGLLFVALSVAPRRERDLGPRVIRQTRAAAALLAFSNALAVSLFSLVPGTNVGYPSVASIMALAGHGPRVQSGNSATTDDEVVTESEASQIPEA